MRPGERTGRGDRGFTYLGLLFLVALIGLALATAGEVAATTARREREAQLLWAGHEYRAAIGRYWNQRRSYPMALQDLIGTGGDAKVQLRFLRRLYTDPVSGGLDWVLVLAPGGGIMGVASSSKGAPLKTGGFDEADQGFDEAKSYADWKFTFQPGPVRRRPRTP